MPRKIILFVLLILTACTNSTSQPQITATNIPPQSSTSTPKAAETLPVNTSTPQPPPSPVTYGPNEFPEGYNPLTGQRVSDPARLEYPAILLSISHFPPAARPQAGLSFSPFVYEYYITEGSTRHVAVVYGEFPEPEIPLHGDCEVRAEPITRTDAILGNLVWHDKNRNGVQDPREGGIGGICVNLLDESGTLLQKTTTDSNGYYGFNVEAGSYTVEFERPSWLEFTKRNIGDEATDSDVNPDSGRTDPLRVSAASLLHWDHPFGPYLLQIHGRDVPGQLPDLCLGR
jgi:hypothetical protein